MTVQDWLHRTKPAAILGLLKEPDYGFAVSRVFLGFRPDAKGFSNPLVRTRLAQAAVKDSKLADKLKELAETEPKPPALAPKSSPTPALSAPAKPDTTERIRAERDQRRRERDEARQGFTEAEAQREIARRAQQAAEAERDEATRLAKKQAERIARLERQVAQLRETEMRLVRALNEDKVSPPPSSPARSAGKTSTDIARPISPWLTAVRHLLDKGKFEQALALAEDVLKANPEETDALEIAARALEGKKDARNAIPFVRRLLAAQIARQDMPDAADNLLRLLRLLPQPEEADADARQYLAALAPADTAAVEAGRMLLTRLRGSDPAAHGWLTGVIAARTSLAPILMPPPGALGLDDPLPLRLGTTVSARQLMEAIDRGDPLVDSLRAAIAALETSDPETHARLWTALEHAASDEPARLISLRRTPRGPIIVDGSNVAWFDQESLVHGKPRLRHLLAMRRALWTRGFFPVVLYADANLPYFVDEPAALRAMRDRRELMLVDAGTVADEVLLRQAKLLGAPLVTNDRMEDWDPEREVTKVRYTISMGGEAHLLADI
ncbi:MAG: hypothetical protein M3Y13_15340 [Armatimonadota bacterium]|nr:hypothetical protein [Armatimonadota bacterium]